MRRFKFKGDLNDPDLEDGTYGGLVIGEIYPYDAKLPICLFNATDSVDYVKFYIGEYPENWEEVFEEALRDTTQKMYTLDEVVEAARNWGGYGVSNDDVLNFFAHRNKQIKLAKIKELEEQLAELKKGFI